MMFLTCSNVARAHKPAQAGAVSRTIAGTTPSGPIAIFVEKGIFRYEMTPPRPVRSAPTKIPAHGMLPRFPPKFYFALPVLPPWQSSW